MYITETSIIYLHYNHICASIFTDRKIKIWTNIVMDKKYLKNYSLSLAIREIKTKATEILDHPSQNSKDQLSNWQQILLLVLRERKLLVTAGGNANWCSHSEINAEDHQKTKNKSTVWPSYNIPWHMIKRTYIILHQR